MIYTEKFTELIKEICKEKSIKLEVMSYGYLLRLEKDNNYYYIASYKFELNNQTSATIARDKYATYEVLKRNNIPVIKSEILINSDIRGRYCKKDSLEKAKEFFYANNKQIVLKPNKGLGGKNVYFCDKEEKIKEIITNIYKSDDTAVMCPYYNIKTEYRTIYLKGKCMVTYSKNIPYLIGDGVSNVKELLRKDMNIELSGIKEENLKRLDFSYIPEENEKVEIFWKHNLSGGANPIILEDCELRRKIQEIVKKAAKAIKIDFSSIDVIETTTGELYLLEANSGIYMENFIEKNPNGRKIAKQIYSEALDEMLKNK